LKSCPRRNGTTTACTPNAARKLWPICCA
jgi:hypothetical protein